MSVKKTVAAAAPDPAPRAAAQSATDIGRAALITDATNAGLTRANYNLVVSGNEIQVWIPRGEGFGKTRDAFVRIFKAAGFTETQGVDRYTHQPKTVYVDANRVTYGFQADDRGGAAVMRSGGATSIWAG